MSIYQLHIVSPDGNTIKSIESKDKEEIRTFLRANGNPDWSLQLDVSDSEQEATTDNEQEIYNILGVKIAK